VKLIKHMDQGWIEKLGGQGLIYVLSLNSSRLDYRFFLSVKIYFFGFFFILLFIIYLFCLFSLQRA
jgi:hypothetical protein